MILKFIHPILRDFTCRNNEMQSALPTPSASHFSSFSFSPFVLLFPFLSQSHIESGMNNESCKRIAIETSKGVEYQ